MAFIQNGESGESNNERNNRSKKPPASTNNRTPTHEENEEGTNSQHEAAFATRGEIVCRRCGEKEHKSPNCRVANDKAETYKATQGGNTGYAQLVSSSVNWDLPGDRDKAKNFMFLLYHANGLTQGTEHKDDGLTAVHQTMAFSMASSGIPTTWILLDNQSTCDIFANPALLRDI
jgi:hypothetical protein